MAGKSESTSNENLRFKQDAHILGLLAVLPAVFYILPRGGSVTSTAVNMAYIISYGLSLGIQFWMTFINGLTLIKTIPRHWFGAVQSKFFALYFRIVLTTNVIMLLVNIYHQADYTLWSTSQKAEVAGIGITILCCVVQLLHVMPVSLEIMGKMYALEKEEGFLDIIGRLPEGALSDNKQYEQIRKSFFKIHGISSVSNLITVACALLPAYNIALRI